MGTKACAHGLNAGSGSKDGAVGVRGVLLREAEATSSLEVADVGLERTLLSADAAESPCFHVGEGCMCRVRLVGALAPLASRKKKTCWREGIAQSRVLVKADDVACVCCMRAGRPSAINLVFSWLVVAKTCVCN